MKYDYFADTKKMKSKPSPTTNRSLPDDLVLNCLARVSRKLYPTLSLVSKRFGSLLASPDVYRFRSLLNHTESCLYVCLRYSSEYLWFNLRYQKPNQTLTDQTGKKNKKLLSGYVLSPVPIPHSPLTNVSSLVSVGSSIYSIGSTENSSSVWILDCLTHTWHKGPSLKVELERFSVSVLDEKIYVAGYYKDSDSNSFKNWFEVFDTKKQSWEPKHVYSSETKGAYYHKSVCIEGKFHIKVDKNVVGYNPKQGKWELVKGSMWGCMALASACVIDDVLYARDNEEECFKWYDTKASKWKNLWRLVGLPMFPCDACVRLADYGGKMAVIWDGTLPSYVGDWKMFWCAVIALERCKKYGSREILGKVEWFDHVLTVDSGYSVVKVLAANV